MIANGKHEASIKLGSRVRIRHTNGLKGKVVELRGPLGPDGVNIFRIQIRTTPEPGFIEVREDQLEILHSRQDVGGPTLG
jgi:hypothetical protein